MSLDGPTSPETVRSNRGSPGTQSGMSSFVKRRSPMSRGMLAPITVSVSPLLLIVLLPIFIFASFVTQPTAFPSHLMRVNSTMSHRSKGTIRVAADTEQERPAVIAYSLQISAATVGHLPRLFQRLYHPQNIHAIHFDVKIPDEEVDAAMKQVQARVPDYKSSTYVVPRQLVTYDGVSIVLNTLSVMSYLLNEVSTSWDFFINLSGSDYPLVASSVPRKLLGKARGYSPLFFSFARRERWEAAFKARAATFHFDDALTHQNTAGELRHVKARNPLVDRLHFVPAYAEAWMIVPREFCRYVTSSDTGRKMLVTVGNMRGGDEHFFVTLAYNEVRYNASIVGNSMRKVVWEAEGKHAGQHPFYVDERRENGKGWMFLETLRRSCAFHARKFRVAESEFMDEVDGFAEDERRMVAGEKVFDQMISGLKFRLERSKRSRGSSENRAR